MKKAAGIALVFTLLCFCTPFAQPVPPREEAPPPVVRFFVREIRVVGSTALSPSEIRGLVSPEEGKTIDLETLKTLADRITRAYQKRGYLLAQAYVPPQNIKNGVVEIDVVEGKIGEIKIAGNRGYSSKLIRYYLSPATSRGIFQSETLEKAVALLNEFPDLHVQTFLQAGKEPGTIDMLVRVEDKTPLHEVVDYNNFGAFVLGHGRAGLEVYDGNLSGKGDFIDAHSTFPFPSDEHPFYQLSYSLPIHPSGTKMTASYANADIKVGGQLQVLDIRGVASIYGLNFSQPLTRSAGAGSDASLGFSIKNVSNFFFGGIQTSRDRLRELTLGYDAHWTGALTRDFFDASLSRGLGSILAGSRAGNGLSSRAGADDSFTKINGDFLHVNKIFQRHFLVLRGSAQYAFSPLTQSEEFSIGGSDSVRGYPQSEFLGDSGWTLSAEARTSLTPENSPDSVQIAYFIDTGFSTARNPQAGETSKEHLTGWGFGIRAQIGQDTSIRADLGYPIDPPHNSTNENPILYAQFYRQF